MENDPIVITAATRTPIGHFNGQLQHIAAPELGAHAISGLMKSTSIDVDLIDYVDMGCVLTAGLGQAPARQAAHAANLAQHSACVTTNKMCGSGLQAVLHGLRHLQANTNSIVVAGGMENMSQAPYLIPKARQGLRLGHHTLTDHLMFDGLEDALQHQPMGHFAELCANTHNITREQQDDYAQSSMERAKQATKQGLFDSEMTPITLTTRKKTTTLSHDEGLDYAKPELISSLKPVFDPAGTVTAANASNISDGAAAVLMMRQSKADALQLPRLATICGMTSHAQAPEWFTTAPIKAMSSLMQQLAWTKESIDCFEINEAFAVVPLVAMQTLQLPHDKVNVHGGACVLGHPIGASGTRILVTLIHALQQRQQKRGLAAICIGGGEALAIAIETH